MKFIPSSDKSKTLFIIDDEDYERVILFKWHITKWNTIHSSSVPLSTFLLGITPIGFKRIFINGNSLDHRKENLGLFKFHGMSNTPEHRAWNNMIQRCYNPNIKDYPNYGGRGIKVCDRWKENFLIS